MNPVAEVGMESRSAPARVEPGDAPTRMAQSPTGLLVGGALIGSIMAVVGSFLPWVKAEFLFWSMEVSGVKGGDGIISLVAAVAAGVLSLLMLAQRPRLFGALTMIAGGVVAATALYDIGHYYRLVSDDPILGNVAKLAPGIYITAVGGAIAAASGLLALVFAGSPVSRPGS